MSTPAHLIVRPKEVIVRLPSPGGAVVADYREHVREGESWSGYSYDELRELGTGQHEIDPRRE